MFCIRKTFSPFSASVKKSLKRANGFHLIEVMSVLVIVSLLLSISTAKYRTTTQSNERFLAEAALLKIASALENYHLTHQTYVAANIEALDPSANTLKGYRLALQSLSELHYRIIALPIGDEAANGCGSLSIDELGMKTVSGTQNSHACWRM
jgi:type IV pilus assembly protein PilE